MKADESIEVPLAAKGNRARVARYRSRNRRIDYAPAADVMRMVEQHLGSGLDGCLVGVLDKLIRAGHRAITGYAGTR